MAIRSPEYRMPTRLTVFLAAALLTAVATAADPEDLPDIGSPADAVLSRGKAEAIGRGVLRQMREAGYVLEDPEVAEYVLGQPGAREFLDAYVAALRPVLEGYQRENKRHATIALGCTGGKHRSVALVRELASRLRTIPGLAVSVKHRDLGRE
jgi:hypothetical protein